MSSGVSDHAELLLKYQPVIRFDSHEGFFAHHVRAMADNQSFALTRGRDGRPDADRVIARHGPGADGLGLEFLGLHEGSYPGGEPYEPGDHFALRLTGPDAFADRIGDYREMERQLSVQWRDCIFGRAVTDGADLWLQYWFFYIYNDAQFGGRVDLHEGDWEMIQILVDGAAPVRAVYAQHAYAERREWEDVELEDGRPIVYSGRGSHASYFEAGLQRTYLKLGSDFHPLWWDAADGNGPRYEQRLEVIDGIAGWSMWRGAWGGTQPRIPELDGASPGGPTTHGQWEHPSRFAASARAPQHAGDLPVSEAVQVSRAGHGYALEFDFGGALGPSPDRLIVTVTSDGQLPQTDTIVVDSLVAGRVQSRHELDPDRAYAVSVSTISPAGVPSGPGKPIRIGPAAPEEPPALLAAPLSFLDRCWQSVASLLRRRVRRS